MIENCILIYLMIGGLVDWLAYLYYKDYPEYDNTILYTTLLVVVLWPVAIGVMFVDYCVRHDDRNG